MKKTIILGKGYGIYEEGGKIVLLDEDLEITVKTNNESIDLYYTASNGTTEIKGKIKDNLITLSRKFLKIGTLRLKIFGLVGDSKVCEYSIEDLIISEIDGKIEAIPQVEYLLEQFNEYSKKMEKFMASVEKLMKLSKFLCDIDIKLGEWYGAIFIKC